MEDARLPQITEVSNPKRFPFLEKNKLFVIPFFIVIILLVIYFLYININKNNISKPPSVETKNKVSIPKDILDSPNLLFTPNPDPGGRNIYYSTQSQGPFLHFSGIGVYFLPEKTEIRDDKNNVVKTIGPNDKYTSYMVGSFVKWENIPNSKDRYLYLQDRIGIVEQKTNQPLSYPLIRIGFSPKDFDNKKYFGTILGVEDLGSVLPKVLDINKGVKYYYITPIGTLTPEDIDKLIKPGDILSIIVNHDPLKGDTVDNKGAKIAVTLAIRRFDPKQTLFSELNKNLNLK